MESIIDRKNVTSEPPEYPLLGHLPDFLRDKLGFLSKCAANYGDVVKLKIGEPTYLLTNPEDIGHVLVRNPHNYDKTPRMTSERGKRLSGEGLLTTATGEEHLRQRRMMQPPFHKESIEKFSEMVVLETQKMLSEWEDGSVLNIESEMMKLTQRNILKALFSTDIGNNIEELAEAITIRRRYMDYMFFSFLPFPEYMPTRINFEYRKTIKWIDNFIYALIRKRRADAKPPCDLLTMLMYATYQDGSVMNDKQLRDEVLTLSITGYETTGVALAWASYLISQHPNIESKLLSELNEVLNGRSPTLEDLSKLKYTEMILDESMRLYPPTWIFVRIAKEDDMLPSGARIPAGSKIYLCQYVIHRNPKYFPDPDRFDPERFTEENKKSRPKHSYFPFGSGPRVCIGKEFAKMEGILILASIAQRFKLELMSGQTIVPEPRMTLSPKNGISMRLKQHSQNFSNGS